MLRKLAAGVTTLAVLSVVACAMHDSRPRAFEDVDVERTTPLTQAQEFVDGLTQELGNFGETVQEGFATPEATPQAGDPRVGTLDESVKYNRGEQFGGWATIHGCDTRNVILQRDLRDITLDSDGCRVLTGVLQDPYTGASINFTRGQDTSRAVQIDHIVPLEYAFRAGAHGWSQEEREAFANAPENLQATEGSINASKGSKGPAAFLPPADACTYATKFLEVAATWELIVTQADLDAKVQACS